MSLYINFCLFAFIASITPGPTNVISLMIGTKQGALAALPFILGASISMTLILWLSGIGLASMIVSYPILQLIMSLGGGIWMSWLAWKLLSGSPGQTSNHGFEPIGWLQGAGLQLINPKTWMMALSTAAIFIHPDSESLQHISWLAFIFFMVAIPCQLCWSWLGQSAKRIKSFPKWEIWINRLLALSLLGTVWSTLLMT